MVREQGDYHLLCPVKYNQGNKIDPWAVKNKLKCTLSGTLPKHEVANVASTTTYLASGDDATERTAKRFVQFGIKRDNNDCQWAVKGR